MTISFEIRMDASSLSGFVLYHNYMRPGGIIGVFLSIAAIVALIIRWGHWTGVQRCLLIVLALLFLVFQPLMLLQKANTQLHSGAFKYPMEYEFGEDHFSIGQDGKTEEFDYADIRKVVLRKNVIYIYMTTVSAFIIPRAQCKDVFDEVKSRLKKRDRRG